MLADHAPVSDQVVSETKFGRQVVDPTKGRGGVTSHAIDVLHIAPPFNPGTRIVPTS